MVYCCKSRFLPGKYYLRDGKAILKLAISLPEWYMNKQRVELFFYIAFLMLILMVMPLFAELQKRVKNKHRTMSILKLCYFVRSNMEAFSSCEKCSHILKIAEYYCLYDHRKKRVNAIEQTFFIILRLTRMRFYRGKSFCRPAPEYFLFEGETQSGAFENNFCTSDLQKAPGLAD